MEPNADRKYARVLSPSLGPSGLRRRSHATRSVIELGRFSQACYFQYTVHNHQNPQRLRCTRRMITRSSDQRLAFSGGYINETIYTLTTNTLMGSCDIRRVVIVERALDRTKGRDAQAAQEQWNQRPAPE